MPGVVPAYPCGPITFEVSANVVGGQLVVPDGTTQKVKPSVGGDATVLGIATKDAVPSATSQDSTVPISQNAFNFSPVSPYVAVAGDGTWPMTAAAAIAFGALVKAAAAGAVTPFVEGTDDASLVVGQCVDPAGIASGSVGLIRLKIS